MSAGPRISASSVGEASAIAFDVAQARAPTRSAPGARPVAPRPALGEQPLGALEVRRRSRPWGRSPSRAARRRRRARAGRPRTRASTMRVDAHADRRATAQLPPASASATASRASSFCSAGTESSRSMTISSAASPAPSRAFAAGGREPRGRSAGPSSAPSIMRWPVGWLASSRKESRCGADAGGSRSAARTSRTSSAARCSTRPALTLTWGHAAIHQAIAGDRLLLPLDAELSRAVTGADQRARPPEPGLRRGDRPVHRPDPAGARQPLLPRPGAAAPGVPRRHPAHPHRGGRAEAEPARARTAPPRAWPCCGSRPRTSAASRCSTSTAAR